MGMRRSCPVLVGRDEDLADLETAIAGRRDRPVVLVGGEAGIGKTRIVAEVIDRFRATGGVATVGTCLDLGADALPFGPFVDAIARYLDLLGADDVAKRGPGASDLETLLPELMVEGHGGTAVTPGRLYEAVRALLDLADAPLALVLEDIHWADQSSLELLAYLCRRLRSGRAVIIATFRTDELQRRHPLVPVLAEIARSGRSTRVDLDRLDAAGVASVVHAMRGEATEELVSAIAARSEGNPFLVEELLAGDRGPAATMPTSLREIMLARLVALDERTRELLGLVAALGRPVDFELLQEAWRDQEGLDQAVAAAVDHGLLIVEPSAKRLSFRHALIGEAVGDEQLPGERIRCHATIARVLRERPDLAAPTRAGGAAELAHHLIEARDLSAAAACAEAGRAAAAARAYPEARAMFEKALELLERSPKGADAGIDPVELLDAAAEASFHCGDAARAVALGRRAVAETEQVGTPLSVVHQLCRLLEWMETTADPGEIAALAERAIALVPAGLPSRERSFALLSLASARMHAGRDRVALELATECVASATACAATGIEACARALIAVSLAGLGHDDAAIAAIDEAVELAEAAGGPAEISVAHIDRPAVYGLAGRFAELPAILAASRHALEREGIGETSEVFLATDDIDLLAWAGRWDEVEDLVSRMLQRSPSRLPLASLLTGRGQVRIRSGRFEEGEADLHGVIGISPPVEPELRASALGLLSEGAIERGDPGAALRLVEAALAELAATDEVPGRAHLFALGLRAAADLEERSRARREPPTDVSPAVTRLRDGVAAGRSGRLVEGGATDGRVAARLAWADAEDERRLGRWMPDRWAAAATALAATGEPHLAAYARTREAEAVLATGDDRDRASRALRDAHGWASLAGARPLRRAAESLARRARLDIERDAEVTSDAPQPDSDARLDPYRLSEREREVLALLLDGRTNREIGAALFITEKTASSHVTHIMDKLGVTSRGAAAALAARAGLLGDA